MLYEKEREDDNCVCRKNSAFTGVNGYIERELGKGNQGCTMARCNYKRSKVTFILDDCKKVDFKNNYTTINYVHVRNDGYFRVSVKRADVVNNCCSRLECLAIDLHPFCPSIYIDSS